MVEMGKLEMVGKAIDGWEDGEKEKEEGRGRAASSGQRETKSDRTHAVRQSSNPRKGGLSLAPKTGVLELHCIRFDSALKAARRRYPLTSAANLSLQAHAPQRHLTCCNVAAKVGEVNRGREDRHFALSLAADKGPNIFLVFCCGPAEDRPVICIHNPTRRLPSSLGL